MNEYSKKIEGLVATARVRAASGRPSVFRPSLSRLAEPDVQRAPQLPAAPLPKGITPHLPHSRLNSGRIGRRRIFLPKGAERLDENVRPATASGSCPSQKEVWASPSAPASAHATSGGTALSPLSAVLASGSSLVGALNALEPHCPKGSPFVFLLRRVSERLQAALQRSVLEVQQNTRWEVRAARKQKLQQVVDCYRASVESSQAQVASSIRQIGAIEQWHRRLMDKVLGVWTADQGRSEKALEDHQAAQRVVLDLQSELSAMYESQVSMWLEYASLGKISDEISAVEEVNLTLTNQRNTLRRQLADLWNQQEKDLAEVAEFEDEVGRMGREISTKTAGMRQRVEETEKETRAAEAKLRAVRRTNERLAAERDSWEQRYREREAAELRSWTPRPDRSGIVSMPEIGLSDPAAVPSTKGLVDFLAKRLSAQVAAAKRLQEERVRLKKVFAPIADVLAFKSTDVQESCQRNPPKNMSMEYVKESVQSHTMEEASPSSPRQEERYLLPCRSNVLPEVLRHARFVIDEQWTLAQAEKVALAWLRGLASAARGVPSGTTASQAFNEATMKASSSMWSDTFEMQQKSSNLVQYAQLFAHRSPPCRAVSLIFVSRLPLNIMDAVLASLRRVAENASAEPLSGEPIPLKAFAASLAREYLDALCLGQVELQQVRLAVLLDSAVVRQKVTHQKLAEFSEHDRGMGFLLRVVMHHIVQQHEFVYDALERKILQVVKPSMAAPGLLVVAESSLASLLQSFCWNNQDVAGDRTMRYPQVHNCKLHNVKAIVEGWVDGLEKMDSVRHIGEGLPLPPEVTATLSKVTQSQSAYRAPRSDARKRHDCVDVSRLLHQLRRVPLRVSLGK